jgi:hypothetical protein
LRHGSLRRLCTRWCPTYAQRVIECFTISKISSRLERLLEKTIQKPRPTPRVERDIRSLFARLGLNLHPKKCDFVVALSLEILEILVDTPPSAVPPLSGQASQGRGCRSALDGARALSQGARPRKGLAKLRGAWEFYGACSRGCASTTESYSMLCLLRAGKKKFQSWERVKRSAATAHRAETPEAEAAPQANVFRRPKCRPRGVQQP